MFQTFIEDASPCDGVPDEVLLQVFAHLPPWDVLAVAGVCRRWRALSRDRSLWQGAHLDAGACPHEDVLVATLASAPALRALTFDDPYSAVSIRVLKAVRSLRVPLSGFHLLSMEYDADALQAVVLHLAPHLEELSLRMHRQLTESCLTAQMACMPRLESLRLLGPLHVHPEPSPRTDRWPRLRRLDLRQAVLDRLDFLSEVLCCASERLEALLLPRYAVLPEAVLAQVCRCKRLRSLAPARLEDLVAADSLPQLNQLLVEADLFDPARHAFLSGLRGLRGVRALSLRIGDEAGAVLVAAACPATQHLTLRGTLSRWAVDIAKGTPAVRGLRVVEPAVRLRLGTADPLPLRLAFLEEVCRALPHLQVLDLRRCFQGRAPPELRELLLRVHPTLRIRTAEPPTA